MSEWWRGAVMYQIYPRSFCDARGDGIGDLKGITEKIPYLAALGVDGIWLSPFYKSPMKDFGYDVSDYLSIDPLFGTMQDFEEMLAEMHKHGLKLIIDLVLSHTSDQHEWFKESRRDTHNSKADWYVWADPKPDGSPPNNWLSIFGGVAWDYEGRRGQYYMHSFLTSQPDLNVRNPEVQDALLDVAKFWLEKGVDGFRLDVANFYMHDEQLRDNPPQTEFEPGRVYNGLYTKPFPYDMQRHLYDKSQPENLLFIERLRALTDQYDGKMMVAEIGDDNSMKTCTEYTKGDNRLHTAYNMELLGWHDGAEEIHELFTRYNSYEGGWPAWAFSNHDVLRIASRGKQDNPDLQKQRVKMLTALLTSLRGTIFLYQGEELGLTEADVPFEKLQDPFGIFLYPDSKGRDGCRTPIPWTSAEKNAGFSAAEDTWLPIPEEHRLSAVSTQENDPSSVLNFVRQFLEWRKHHNALITGEIDFDIAKNNLLVFSRQTGDETVIAGFNLGSDVKKLDKAADWELLDGHGLPVTVNDNAIELPAFGGFFAKRV
ncbi:MAG: alpha-glucosidase [Alphaproteobacteria bacterium]|nr:MAG: alpha-glucosidase [Alphaproteobacteria bacterium]